jgi:hypothetical protein
VAQNASQHFLEYSDLASKVKKLLQQKQKQKQKTKRKEKFSWSMSEVGNRVIHEK